jgi:hypothetical protein
MREVVIVWSQKGVRTEVKNWRTVCKIPFFKYIVTEWVLSKDRVGPCLNLRVDHESRQHPEW